MAISFACDCGKAFQVKDELAGRRARCPACGRILTVPPAAPAAATYDLAEPVAPPSPPIARPSTDRPAPAEAVSAPPTKQRPAAPPVAASAPLEYLYWVLILALVPLVVSVFQRGEPRSIEERVQASLAKADPEVRAKVAALGEKGGVDLDELVAVLPGGKVDELALLPRDT